MRKARNQVAKLTRAAAIAQVSRLTAIAMDRATDRLAFPTAACILTYFIILPRRLR
jgi:hypothetical protein